MKINIRSAFHYLLIYSMFLFQGSVFSRVIEDGLAVAVFLISIAIMFLKPGCHPLQLRNFKNYFSWHVGCIGLLLFSSLLNNGSLSLPSIGNVLARLLIAVIVLLYDNQKAITRIVRLSVFLAGMSLLGFIGQVSAPSLLIGFVVQRSFLVNPFFAFGYVMHSDRNIGIYAEPGLYSIVLLVTLYLILFSCDYETSSRAEKRISTIIIILTIITTKSAAAYIGLFVISAFWMFDRRSKDNLSLYKIGVFVLAGGMILLDLLKGSNGLINTYLFGKILASDGSLDVTVSTGLSRIISMQADLEIIKRYPFGAGFQIYEKLWPQHIHQFIPDLSSCMGLTKCLATYGIPAVVLYLVYLVRNGVKNIRVTRYIILAIVVFLMSVLTQPNVFYPILMIPFLSGNAFKESKLEP